MNAAEARQRTLFAKTRSQFVGCSGTENIEMLKRGVLVAP